MVLSKSSVKTLKMDNTVQIEKVIINSTQDLLIHVNFSFYNGFKVLVDVRDLFFCFRSQKINRL